MRNARRGTVSDQDAAAARLSAAIARGDPTALDEFYRAWFDWSYAMARRLTRRDESFCLDVVQDSMLRVARSIRRMPTHADLERWMTRVVHTAALDALRRESRRLARERSRATTPATSDARSEFELKERTQWVRDQLQRLPPADRWLLWLRIARGRTLADAGAASDIGAHAAHGRIRRTIERLRDSAEEEVANGTE